MYEYRYMMFWLLQHSDELLLEIKTPNNFYLTALYEIHNTKCNENLLWLIDYKDLQESCFIN